MLSRFTALAVAFVLLADPCQVIDGSCPANEPTANEPTLDASNSPAATSSTLTNADDRVDFNSQIRPILVANCTSCHGGVKQAGDLSFISASDVLPPDGWVVEPGDPEASILMERITTEDADIRMPPPDEHPDPLSAEDVDLLRRWIRQGANWQNMWALAPLAPQSDAPTGTTSNAWGTQQLDQIVHAQLHERGLEPSEEAPPSQWLRRTAFDLIGLPPSEQQLAEFLEQLEQASTPGDRESVYAAQVDPLLSSPHFGERWASVWMDLARYADSKGFEKDPHRDMWPYRDWLIDAFNADMPYDEFTLKQLAGDLIPNATANDWIATAFHRNTQTNTEGGTDDEEFRIAALIDRVNTTWTVWQASTFGCVQCHSHPYDPIEHSEYYASLAMFNDTVDADLDNDYPTLRIPKDRDSIESAVQLQREAESLRHQRNALGWQVAESISWNSLPATEFATQNGQLRRDGDQIMTDGGTFPPGNQYTVEFNLDTLTSQLEEQTLSALQVIISPRNQDPAQWPEQGSVLSHFKAEWIDADNQAEAIAISEVFVDAITGSNDPSDALRGNATGTGEYPKLTGPRVTVFVLAEPASLESLQEKNVRALKLTMVQSHSTSGNVATPIRRFQWLGTSNANLQSLLQSERWSAINQDWQSAKKAASKISGPNLPVIRNRPETAKRDTRLFLRGNWMDRGDVISPAIPVAFTEGTTVVPEHINNRLELAKWLVSNQNPLTPRVWANRIWAQLFGIGLVETQEDFGSSGLQPTHPQLLDHLAVQLRDEHKWHLKPFLRELVLSATYRQNNHVAEDLQKADPRNQWLARGPRTRLSAEMVRDQALAVSELISDTIGGPSVMPPQPDGVWQTVYSGASWKTAEGNDRYRRGLYTYWRRTSPYPSFLTFDSPTRDLCAPRRIATNTPLQALVTLNDPVYHECAQALVSRAMKQRFSNNDTIDSLISQIFVWVTQSQPSETERSELVALYSDLKEVPETDAESTTIDAPALAIVASTILNLDKALTK
ncbi:PSD1 and planctomycete cytochrome C domain-containing protein [Rhodopirellula sp. JC740]|uniref:PSD1 and planctomycete cytochrome C domain-containing protein n=1 Tax=Rhodopirellula halodulae TaxID=2894198 RepID=A0ABS8NJQ5_9BACT|nr:PSD1 and planctomycete cytochrome C domain-containing protein [Rhodopirellula sp. JC740]MCC9643804.1 PSD1 and planctomycete cytochrome C domain-containing protein [Rhodopirellula sp. JC740]